MMTNEQITSLRGMFDQYGPKGEALMKICVGFTLYYDGGFSANAASVAAFVEKGLAVLGQKPKYCGIDGANKWKPVKDDLAAMVRYWASPECPSRSRYGLRAECGASPRDVSDASLRFYDDGNDPGFLRLTLPLERMDELGALTKEMAAPVPFLSGHAGISVNMAPGYHASLPDFPVYRLSRRFRGVDFGDPLMFATFIRGGLKCAAWMTLIGNELIRSRKMEGFEQSVRAKNVAVAILLHGLVLQAGSTPCAGDVNEQEDISLLHEVGKSVRPLRFPDSLLRGYDGIGGTDNTLEWLHRFDI